MKHCSNPPAKLYCLTARGEKRAVRANEAGKLGGCHEHLLDFDLAKEQLKNKGQGAYVSLFADRDAATNFSRAHGSGTTNFAIHEVDTSKLKGTLLYKVSEIASLMGSAAAKPMPDYFGRGVIPKEALT